MVVNLKIVNTVFLFNADLKPGKELRFFFTRMLQQNRIQSTEIPFLRELIIYPAKIRRLHILWEEQDSYYRLVNL